MKTKITASTRRKIADTIIGFGLSYNGRLREADFLNRLYDLNSLPSTDHRDEYNNAYKDIYQHADRNPGDWQPDWVFTDNRFNLMHCDDEIYLKFLSETLSPAVRDDDAHILKLVEIYNGNLPVDGYHFHQVGEQSGRPLYSWSVNDVGKALLAAKGVAIKKYLNTDYINKKVEQMNKAVETDTEVAIGTGKELLETTCKAILRQKAIAIDKDWTLPQLLKNTTNALDFKPKNADDPQRAEKSILQVLGGITTIVQGVTELRNAYGTGHGKDATFKGLEKKYAQLFVGVVSEIAIIYLQTNGEAEII